jgi:hypothetical protein
MIDIISPMIKQFLPFAQERMGFRDPPKLFLRGDTQNANNPLGKTAFYDPQAKSVTLYITDRHPKDVMRSLSHELVHHSQNCRGDFSGVGEMGEGYAQNDEHLREMEREAYETGNMCFRDWEDSIKSTIYFEHLQKGEKKMSIKDWKNGEIKTLLTEAWGFQMDLSKLNEDIGGAGGELTDKESEEEDYISKDEKEGNLSEDSEEEEGEHYEDSSMDDKDHIKAIEHHLDALKDDKNYDEDHIDEASGDCNDNDREVDSAQRHRQVPSSGGSPGLSEAQIRAVAKRVAARLRRVQHPNTKQ